MKHLISCGQNFTSRQDLNYLIPSGGAISLSHSMRPGLESAIFGWQNLMIELGKFCFIKTKFESNLSCFSK